jgi:hypothetical protein
MMTLELCSLLLQTWGLLVTAIIAAKTRSIRISIPLSIVIMLAVNFIGQVIIAGEGPGACAGFIVLPFLGCTIAWITVIVSKMLCKPKATDLDIQPDSNSNVESQNSENHS